MMLRRAPGPRLSLFVSDLWVSSLVPTPGAPREHVLPTGGMHLVFRLSGAPLRIYDADDAPEGREIGRAIVGGARSCHYVRDVSVATRSVGAQLLPGAAEVLIGESADRLAERHTNLAELWGDVAVDEAMTQLAECRTDAAVLDCFEAILVARLRRLRRIHPAVAAALVNFSASADIATAVDESGFSHRHFNSLFRQAVGITPKLYCRITRFRRAVEIAASDPSASWADLAHACGYSDQPHFVRDFRAFSGLSPTEYRKSSGPFAMHVPRRADVDSVKSVQDRDDRGA
ncbi:MAG: AraC family transcriptional regulator [Polyangiaceae bacterium]|nr:AraC family transcriptional regulator [Polyangiaceae bacterium]